MSYFLNIQHFVDPLLNLITAWTVMFAHPLNNLLVLGSIPIQDGIKRRDFSKQSFHIYAASEILPKLFRFIHTMWFGETGVNSNRTVCMNLKKWVIHRAGNC